jgi:hypothetical protein
MAAPVAKKYVGQRLGINTEAPLTEWPDGYFMDCVNFDILPDGSLKRRPGAALAADGTNDWSTPVDHVELKTHFYIWENVANDSTYKYIVSQIGHQIFISPYVDDANIIQPDNYKLIDLTTYAIVFPNDPALPELMSKHLCSFTSGMGRLYVAHKYANPFYVELNTSTGDLEETEMTILERDLLGVDDEIPVDEQPTTLTDAHRYNLFSRGWTQANIDAYHTAKSKYPAKNMLMAYGYRKYDDVSVPTRNYAPEEGVKEFSSDKMANEFFSQASAPQGHLITKVWDTTQVWSGIGSGDYTTKNMTSVAVVSNNSTFAGRWAITVTSAAHGLVTSDTTYIAGLALQFRHGMGKTATKVTKWFNDTYTVQAHTTDTFTFYYDGSTNVKEFLGVVQLGTFTGDAPLIENNEFGEVLNTRFRLNSYFLGRLWYAGLDENRTKNRIYFSQVIDREDKAELCLTEADPTDLRISDPIVTDGGYIAINELGEVTRLVPFGNSMLVFSSEGIWQIGPGETGFFSPLSYSVRRISNLGTRAPRAIVEVPGGIFYWGVDGIYAIQEDPNSGYLTAQNISKDKINRLYSLILNTGKEGAIGVYDDLDKRILWYYGGLDTDSSELDGSIYFNKIGPSIPATTPNIRSCTQRAHTLVLDLRTGGYYRHQMSWANDPNQTSSIKGVICLPLNLSSNRKQKIHIFTRYIFQPPYVNFGTPLYNFATFKDEANYQDVGPDSSNSVDAFIIAGPETLGDSGRLKQAPYVQCFFRRIEGSSCLMQPVWDWSKTTVTGNVGNPHQVYREVQPRADGSKLIVTKNKVLGKGHSLYLGFHTMPGKPCWIESWQVQYNVSRDL